MITKNNVHKQPPLKEQEFESLFLHGGKDGLDAYEKAITLTTEKLLEVFLDQSQPYIGKTPIELQREIKSLQLESENGETLSHVLENIEGPLLKSNLNISHRKSVAHLHCPPLIPALVAEMVISAFNQSMDSWDQSTAATYLENELIKWLNGKFGLEPTSDGTFTSGGTQSNYMALLLARDHYCWSKWGQHVGKNGLPDGANRLRILCSEHAHFTVKKSAAQLGLGENAVVTVRTDDHHQLCMYDLNSKLTACKEKGLHPFALVGTCGTTDFGSIDPLQEMAELAKQHGVWFHVDAAYGGALILSHTHVDKLSGIDRADSITVDFHKLFYQPISCGAFLVNNKRHFQYIQHNADYLNPTSDEKDGILHLVSKSTQTTKRFDALKLLLSLRMVGTKRFGDMIDATFQLALRTTEELIDRGTFSVLNKEPTLNAVVFRYEPTFSSVIDLNELNKHIQKSLLESGKAVLAKTKVAGNIYLKFTLLNPRTTIKDIQDILSLIEEYGSIYINKWGFSQ